VGHDPYHFKVAPGVLRPGQPTIISFDLPEARTSPRDPRLLGIALQRVSMSVDAKDIAY